jgi:hypothetical protein
MTAGAAAKLVERINPANRRTDAIDPGCVKTPRFVTVERTGMLVPPLWLVPIFHYQMLVCISTEVGL